MAGIDDGTIGAAGEEACHRLDRVLGRRQANAQQAIATERRQALEREGEMAATLVGSDGVNLVDDHGAGGRQHLAAGLRAQQHVKRFRRGDDDMRRLAPHALTLAWRGVAGAHPGPDIDVRLAAPRELGADAGERRLEVALDVVGQGLERRDVDDLRLVPQPALDTLAHQIVDRRHKRRQRLAGPGRSGDQRMAPRSDQRPSVGLRCRRGSEARLEPRGDSGMKERCGRHGDP